MRLLRARFKNYKVFSDETVFLGEKNPQFFFEPNEYGKSTIIEGIKDAFRLKPEEIEKKKSVGTPANPVVEIDFEIKGAVYRLRLNAQDKTISLKSPDGTELTTPKSIEKFLANKGYENFSPVLERLLILRERDLSVATSKGIKELLDGVLHSGRINDLEKRIGEIVGKKGTLIGTFGKEKENLQKKLGEISDRVKEIESQLAEYERDLKELERIQKEAERKKKEKEKLKRIRKELELIIPYRTYGELEKEVQALREEMKKRETKIKTLEESISEKEEKIAQLEKQLQGIREKIGKLDSLDTQIELNKKRLEKLSKELNRVSMLRECERKLGKWKSYGFERLSYLLQQWKHLKKKETKYSGRINVIEAEKTVEIDGKKYQAGDRVEFRGQAVIKYRDLMLGVVTYGEISEELERLKKEYGEIKKLKELVKLARKKEHIEHYFEDGIPELSELETEMDNTRRRIEELECERKEVSKLKLQGQTLLEKLSLLKKELDGEKEVKNSLIGENKQILKILEQKKEKLKNFSRKIEELEEQITIRHLKKYGNDELPKLEKHLKNVRNDEEKLDTEFVKISEAIATLKGKTAKKPDRSWLDTLLIEKLELERKLDSVKRMEKVLTYTTKVLSTLKREIDRKYVKDFQKKTSEIFSNITGNAYSEVKFNAQTLFFDEKEFSNNWEAIRKNGHRFKIGELSDGTSSQLLLSARLALIELLLNNRTFLLLDEPFAYFDNDRSVRCMKILEKLAQNGWQIIVMSAKNNTLVSV